MGDEQHDDLDPSSYAYWRAQGYKGRPPWRRGFRWPYLAIAVALVLGLGTVFVLAANGQL